MARFPSREGDVATLAMEIISGLKENAGDFPSPPLTAEQLQTALDSFHRTHEAAVLAESAAAQAHDVKDDALQKLTDDMRLVLHYAEHAVGKDEVKLRALEVKKEGPGWLYLDWKRPSEGGMVAGYHVQVAKSEGGEWKDVTMCFDTMAVLTE